MIKIVHYRLIILKSFLDTFDTKIGHAINMEYINYKAINYITLLSVNLEDCENFEINCTTNETAPNSNLY